MYLHMYIQWPQWGRCPSLGPLKKMYVGTNYKNQALQARSDKKLHL